MTGGLLHRSVNRPLYIPTCTCLWGPHLWVVLGISWPSLMIFWRRCNCMYWSPNDDVLKRFKEFKALIENQSEYKIKVFRSDNIGEFVSKTFKWFLKDPNIEKQMSTPYRPQEKRVMRLANRTIMEMAKNMLHVQNIHKSFWAEVIDDALYTRNWYPMRALDSITSYEVWSRRRPCIAHMYLCMYMDVLPTQWYQMKRGVNLIQIKLNVCFWIIVRN